MSDTENILVVKTEILGPYLVSEGIISENADKIIGVIMDNYVFIPRTAAETDLDYKQIIPYVVIRRGEEVFLLHRLNKTTEKRLRGLMSLGIGGHINESDENPIKAGLFRELNEEVSLHGTYRLSFLGVLNDNSSDVSLYHTGFVYVLDTGGDVKVLETDKMEGRWVKISELPALLDEMETWSQMIVASGVIAGVK